MPAQKNAGVIKSFDPERENKELAEMAKEFKEELRADIIRFSATAIPEMKQSAIEEICENLSLKSLREMRDAFRENARKNLPVIRQLDVRAADENNENSEYKI